MPNLGIVAVRLRWAAPAVLVAVGCSAHSASDDAVSTVQEAVATSPDASSGLEEANGSGGSDGGGGGPGDGPGPAVGGDASACAGISDPETLCGPALSRSAAIACYAVTIASAKDGQGTLHSGTLLSLVQQALGFDSVPSQPNVCYAPALGCGEPFLEGTVPSFPAAASQDTFDTWVSSVASFYTQAHRTSTGALLTPGQAELCTSWAYEYFKLDPDPSILSALEALASYGASFMVGVDDVYLSNIVAAGSAAGCDTPPALAGNTYVGAWVPLGDRNAFYDGWKTCDPDSPAPGCPHWFDAPSGPGNHVNANYLASFAMCTAAGIVAAAAFFFDPSGQCGMSCYPQ